MLRSIVAALAIALAPSGAGAATVSAPLVISITSPATPANTITVSDASGSGETNYPLQFGRVFLDGAIPSGDLPQVLINGVAATTQADVKNSYPDGSVEYAVIAVVIPSVPANGSVTLSFQPVSASAEPNTALTQAQMLDASYDFDAAMTLVKPAVSGTAPSETADAPGGSLTFGGQTITFGTTETTGGYPILFAGTQNGAALAVYVVGGNLYAENSDNIWYELTNGAWNAIAASPLPSPAVTASADARAMLANGDYTLWTSGPVAQTIILGDDSPARKYDIGFGDGYHPFRPHFEATFWPATHQVYVRFIGENDLTTELEDLPITVSLSTGETSPSVVYTADLSGDTPTGLACETSSPVTCGPKVDSAMSVWTKEFWLGATPPDQVDVDYNLAYLAYTRAIPNYDTTITVSPATIASEYATYWTDAPHDLYDGAWDGGVPWQSGQGTPGDRQDLAPEPTWDALWLYTGDWRMRDLSLGAADLAGAWQVNLREIDPTKRLLTSDPVPAAGATGTGYGLPFSLTDREMLSDASSGISQFLYYASSQGAPADTEPDVVGPLNTTTNDWTSEESHQPDPFFVPYLLTGDPFYLHEMENWASWSMADGNAFHIADWQGRGPTGAEGADYDELRGDAWILVHRAETAFAVPDGDPLKTYYTEQTNSALARWEGALGITGTVFDGTAEKNWAITTGDPETGEGAGVDGQLSEPTGGPPLGNWTSEQGGSASASYCSQDIWICGTGTPPTFEEPWMQWFTLYAAGRAADLGFAAGPLEQHTGAYLTGLIDDSGNPQLVSAYQLPVASGAGPWLATWPQVIALMNPTYLTSTAASAFANSSGQAPISVFFASENYASGYPANAWAAIGELANTGVTSAITSAAAWLDTNVYQPILGAGGWAANPSWDILPYTGGTPLPAMPTIQP